MIMFSNITIIRENFPTLSWGHFLVEPRGRGGKPYFFAKGLRRKYIVWEKVFTGLVEKKNLNHMRLPLVEPLTATLPYPHPGLVSALVSNPLLTTHALKAGILQCSQ